jgi:phenol/toluene 2-monooxygenase (NADH) P5/A5
MLMLAGGTGLAPIKSIITHLLETDLHRQCTLYHGARTVGMLYDVEYFNELAARHPSRFHYRPCISEEQAPGYAHGNVTDILDLDLATCAGHVAYVCGPPPMVEAALKVLMRKRLFPRDIYREDFYDASDKATGGIRSPLLKR